MAEAVVPAAAAGAAAAAKCAAAIRNSSVQWQLEKTAWTCGGAAAAAEETVLDQNADFPILQVLCLFQSDSVAVLASLDQGFASTLTAGQFDHSLRLAPT